LKIEKDTKLKAGGNAQTDQRVKLRIKDSGKMKLKQIEIKT